MEDQNKDVAEYAGDNSAGAGNDKKNNDNNDTINNGGTAKTNKTVKINLPNKLTIFRIILVPVYMIFILIPKNDVLPETWIKIFAAALFLIAALTDLFDGMLARRLNLITNFGKFMDAVADKFMVVGAMIAITASPYFESIRYFAVWLTAIVFFRELAVTSLRLVANTAEGNVIAANRAGKLKTVTQVVCIMTIFLEDIVVTQQFGKLFNFSIAYVLTYLTMIVVLITTIYSGFVYFKAYWKYIDPAK